MSTVQPTASAGSGLVTALKATSAFLALGLLVQAWLGSSGFFNGNPDLITGHEMFANVFVLVGLAQVILAFLAMRKGILTQGFLIVSALILVAVVAQIGLGYAGRDSATALSWHLPNGVLLMGLCTLSLVQVWGSAITRD